MMPFLACALEGLSDFLGQQITVLEPSLGRRSFDMQINPAVGILASRLMQPVALLVREFTSPD
jgi:hypothetical protein